MHAPLHRVTKKLDEYCGVFSDKSEYYSKLDGFYGIEIMCEEQTYFYN